MLCCAVLHVKLSFLEHKISFLEKMETKSNFLLFGIFRLNAMSMMQVRVCVYCSLFTVHFVLLSVCTMYFVMLSVCTMYFVLFSLFTMYFVVLSLCTMYFVLFSVCTMYFVVLS